ncbi:MAG: TolC family protein [Alistipes sp.]|nr:TolC family protein [Alistipes sp.]
MKTTFNIFIAGIFLGFLPVSGIANGQGEVPAVTEPALFLENGPTDQSPAVSLTFEEYLEMVMSRNHGLAVERLRVPIAEAEIKAARVAPDPEFAFEGAGEMYSIELGYTIEFGRKRRGRINYAKTFAEMEKSELRLFTAELRLAAAEAFIEAMAEAQMLEVKRSSYEYMLELSGSDSLRFRAGEITENEARQSALEANTLLGEVYQQEGDYLAALAVLGYFTGISSDTLVMPAGVIRDEMGEVSLSALVANGLANRVENELAMQSVELARRELAVAKSEQKPDVDIFIGYERDWKGFYNSRKLLKGGVTIPLKFSAVNKGSVRAAGYAVEQERRQEMNVHAQIETEIVQAFHLYNAARKTYNHYLSGVMEQARKVLDGAVYSYMAGETDLLEVLIAQRTYNEIREEFIESGKEARLATVNLMFACGML